MSLAFGRFLVFVDWLCYACMRWALDFLRCIRADERLLVASGEVGCRAGVHEGMLVGFT